MCFQEFILCVFLARKPPEEQTQRDSDFIRYPKAKVVGEKNSSLSSSCKIELILTSMKSRLVPVWPQHCWFLLLSFFFGKDGDKKCRSFFVLQKKTGFTEIKHIKDADQWKTSCASHMTCSAHSRGLDGLKSLRGQLGSLLCVGFFFLCVFPHNLCPSVYQSTLVQAV